jgi:uncharacterized protein YecT (DUF1311 family)
MNFRKLSIPGKCLQCVLLLCTLLALGCGQALANEPSKEPERVEVPFSVDDDGCGGAGNLQEVQCIGAYLERLDKELNRVYQLALQKMPVTSDLDTRKSREQLRKSQRAWLQFKQENCVLRGGLEGGSNLWVTHFAALCEESEVRARIKFLKQIADDVPLS